MLQALGLAAPIASTDHIRNIMASPTAGIDPQALIDT
jgi:ferredoxin-nitrite reductase